VAQLFLPSKFYSEKALSVKLKEVQLEEDGGGSTRQREVEMSVQRAMTKHQSSR